MPLPVHRMHPEDKVDLFVTSKVKRGDLIKPYAGEEARMRGRLAEKGEKGVLFIAGHDGENELVACYDWLYQHDENVQGGESIVMGEEGKTKIKATPTSRDRVVGETLSGGTLLMPNLKW